MQCQLAERPRRADRQRFLRAKTVAVYSRGPHRPSARLMPKPRRSKTLEKVARSIHDSDEFVQHVFGIAARYRAQLELETGEKGQSIRRSLLVFARHATALEEWLRHADKVNTAEAEALRVLAAQLQGSASGARAQTSATRDFLTSALAASERTLQSLKRSKTRLAPPAAADALRATFEYHGLKVSSKVTGDTVRLLAAIAKDSGDEMSVDEAREWLRPAPRTPK